MVGNPSGGDVLRLTGTGINVLTLGLDQLRPASSAVSQDLRRREHHGDGTWVDVYSPATRARRSRATSSSVSLGTVAGNSDTRSFRYLPIQLVTSLSTDVLPAAGYARLLVKGIGLQSTAVVLFEPVLATLPTAEVASCEPGSLPSCFRTRSSTEITLVSPNVAPGSYVLSVCATTFCGPSRVLHPIDDTVEIIDPSSTAVTSAELAPGGASPRGPVAGGTTFEIQGTNFGALSQLRLELVDAAGATATTAAIVAGPRSTDPGATQTLLVTSPPSPTGDPGTFSVLLSGADGTSTVTPTARFSYTT